MLHLPRLQRVTDFHIAVEQDFYPVGAGGLEFRVEEDLHAGGRGHVVGEADRYLFALADHGDAVGPDEAAFLCEFPLAATPAVDQAELMKDGGVCRYAESVKEPDQDELSVPQCLELPFIANLWPELIPKGFKWSIQAG